MRVQSGTVAEVHQAISYVILSADVAALGALAAADTGHGYRRFKNRA
jgi:hypothetical protein